MKLPITQDLHSFFIESKSEAADDSDVSNLACGRDDEGQYHGSLNVSCLRILRVVGRPGEDGFGRRYSFAPPPIHRLSYSIHHHRVVGLMLCNALAGVGRFVLSIAKCCTKTETRDEGYLEQKCAHKLQCQTRLLADRRGFAHFNGRHASSNDRGDLAHLRHQEIKLIGEERLRAIGQSLIRLRMHFDHQPIGADRD